MPLPCRLACPPHQHPQLFPVFWLGWVAADLRSPKSDLIVIPSLFCTIVTLSASVMPEEKGCLAIIYHAVHILSLTCICALQPAVLTTVPSAWKPWAGQAASVNSAARTQRVGHRPGLEWLMSGSLVMDRRSGRAGGFGDRVRSAAPTDCRPARSPRQHAPRPRRTILPQSCVRHPSWASETSLSR